jgi:putative protein-disulfide isomerase
MTSPLSASDACNMERASAPGSIGGGDPFTWQNSRGTNHVSLTDMILNPHATRQAPTVVYANDPLCGWCFAIGPSLNDARINLGADVQWRIECGGLVTGERVRPIVHDREYLVSGFAQVKATSGRVPGDKYWTEVVEPGTWVSNSEPACRAVLLMQQLQPAVAMTFSHALTDALYLDGRTPEDPGTLRSVAEQFGVDGDRFVAQWQSPDAIAITRTAFAHARQIGVTTYPSLFLEVGGELHLILAGFATAAEIASKVRTAIATHEFRGV